MQKFWYHSPVRFYKNKEEHRDMYNPQNNQYFGGTKHYPLEVGEWHRFLLPMYDNNVAEDFYELYLVNDYQREKIESSVFIENGMIKHISFKSIKPLEGRLELVNKLGEPVLYSNCVRFLDSTDFYGRKFIRVATKNTYNRCMFDFEADGAWFITNLPAYCLGMTNIDIEVSNNRTGGNSSLRIKDSHIDEIVKYEFDSNGDSNVLNFIQTHAVNHYFFIDGVQKTSLEKLERDDFSMGGTLEFANVKDENGLNIQFDEQEIWNDMRLKVLEMQPTHNQSMRLPNVNSNISIKFNQHFALTTDLSKKIRIYKNGRLFISKSFNQVVKDGYTIKILDNQTLDVGVYKVNIDDDFIKGHIGVIWDFTIKPENIIQLSITWGEGGVNDLSGVLNTIDVVNNSNSTTDNTDKLKRIYWEIDEGNGFYQYVESGILRNITIQLRKGVTRIRLKGVTREGNIGYSNILQYTKDN